MRALVTGGTGFIGSALVRRLYQEGYEVRALDNDLRGQVARLDDLANSITLIRGDCRDAKIVTDAAEGCDVVVHLAALNGTENFYRRPDLVLDVGVRSMLAVLDACSACRVPSLVVASSSEAYQSATTVPTPENVQLVVPDVQNPRYSYGASKLISEVLTLNFARKNLQRAVVFRPHNVYGPDMGWEHVIPQFALRAYDLDRQQSHGPLPFPIQGNGNQTRAFVHIDDFVDGVMIMIEKGKHLEIYHIGTQEEITMGALAEKVAAVFNRTVELVPGPAPEGETERRCPDIGKLKLLGYSPRIPIDDGLKTTVQWYARHANERPAKS